MSKSPKKKKKINNALKFLSLSILALTLVKRCQAMQKVSFSLSLTEKIFLLIFLNGCAICFNFAGVFDVGHHQFL